MSIRAVGTGRRGLGRRSAAQARQAKMKTGLTSVLIHAMLIAITVASVMPLVYMISTSLKLGGREFAFPIEWIPNPIVWGNYETALTRVPTLVFFKNTMIVTITKIGRASCRERV